MPPPVGGAKQYDAKLRKKDVKVEVGSMGLQVWPKKGSVPTTYLYQTLLSWEVVEAGSDDTYVGARRSLLLPHSADGGRCWEVKPLIAARPSSCSCSSQRLR